MLAFCGEAASNYTVIRYLATDLSRMEGGKWRMAKKKRAGMAERQKPKLSKSTEPEAENRKASRMVKDGDLMIWLDRPTGDLC